MDAILPKQVPSTKFKVNFKEEMATSCGWVLNRSDFHSLPLAELASELQSPAAPKSEGPVLFKYLKKKKKSP